MSRCNHSLQSIPQCLIMMLICQLCSRMDLDERHEPYMSSLATLIEAARPVYTDFGAGGDSSSAVAPAQLACFRAGAALTGRQPSRRRAAVGPPGPRAAPLYASPEAGTQGGVSTGPTRQAPLVETARCTTHVHRSRIPAAHRAALISKAVSDMCNTIGIFAGKTCIKDTAHPLYRSGP